MVRVGFTPASWVAGCGQGWSPGSGLAGIRPDGADYPTRRINKNEGETYPSFASVPYNAQVVTSGEWSIL
ncbi:hypothetical protein AKJ16_DCAP19621 [Drosera capensis]